MTKYKLSFIIAIAVILVAVGLFSRRANAPILTNNADQQIRTGPQTQETASSSKEQQATIQDLKTPATKSADTKTIEAGTFVRPSDAEIKAKLTPLQYEVTQQEGTEQPFQNEYWNNEKAGLYVDIVSGEPLFSSTDKYDSQTGWPSFTKPISPTGVIEKTDTSLGMERTEVVSAIAKSHLGHLFMDGPAPLGTRYCMNSASLKFIAVADLQAQGYGKYNSLFQ